VEKTIERNGIRIYITGREHNGKTYYDFKLSKPYKGQDGTMKDSAKFSQWDADSVLMAILEARAFVAELSKPKRADSKVVKAPSPDLGELMVDPDFI
jgi:hypothetical protein